MLCGDESWSRRSLQALCAECLMVLVLHPCGVSANGDGLAGNSWGLIVWVAAWLT